MRGALTEHLDGVQLLVAAFFIFFALLIYYLRRADKMEGYPLVDASPVGKPIEGFPEMPEPKRIERMWREPTQMPHNYGPSRMHAERLLRFPGAPLVPLGNPMLAEVGPGAFPLRDDTPLLSGGLPQVVPLRADPAWSVAKGDVDPRGLDVFDGRHTAVGTVTELWVDRGVKILRYLEVTLAAPAEGRVLLPIYYADISRRRGWVRVRALLAPHFALVPRLKQDDQITALEEDRVNAFYANGEIFSRGSGGFLPVDQLSTGLPR